MQYQNLLQSIGLSDSEARLYLVSLRLGPASAIHLAKKLQMSRQIVYNLTDKLITQGLMKEVRAGTKRHFQALGPDVLNDRARQVADEISAAVPVLKTKEAGASFLPVVSVYENPIAMREWYREFMHQATAHEELLIWATNTAWYTVDPHYLDSFVAFKSQVGTKDLIIAPDTKQSRQFVVDHPQPNATTRFSKDWWETDTEKWIWRDTISYLTIKENVTNMIVVRSAQLAALERFNFYQIWKQLR